MSIWLIFEKSILLNDFGKSLRSNCFQDFNSSKKVNSSNFSIRRVGDAAEAFQKTGGQYDTTQRRLFQLQEQKQGVNDSVHQRITSEDV